MRTLVAILFSFLIAGTQAAFPLIDGAGGGSAAVNAKCACTHCEATCCPAPVGRGSAPLPAIPSAAQSQTDWQALSVVVLSLIDSRNLALEPVHIYSIPLSSSGQVPLYERNCAYLI